MTLAQLAVQLRTLIQGAGYTVDAIDPLIPTQLVITNATPFYAGFQISHDLAGGATVSPALSNGAIIAFTGVPALGEVWTLTLASVQYSVTAQLNESLSSVVQRLAALLPSSVLVHDRRQRADGLARREPRRRDGERHRLAADAGHDHVAVQLLQRGGGRLHRPAGRRARPGRSTSTAAATPSPRTTARASRRSSRRSRCRFRSTTP